MTGLSTALKSIIALALASFFLPAMADDHFESVVKDADFRASIDLEPDEAFIELSEGFTYYRMTARDQCDTPDVLVHGFSVPSYIWEPTYDFLAGKGRCVIMLDLYGRGFSDNPDVAYTDTLFATQVLELLDALGVERASFFGLSNGGRVVSQIAGLAPARVTRLVYVASSGFRDVTRAADTSVSQDEIDELIEKYSELPAGQLSDFKDPTNFQDWDDKYAELLVHKGFARALISTRKNHDSEELDRIHASLQTSNIPVATIWGDSDTVVVYAGFADKIERLLPKRQEFFITDSGHLPHMENSDQFEAALTTILGL